MIARRQRGVGKLRGLDGDKQFTFKRRNPRDVRHPPLDAGWLHDNALDFVSTIERPSRFRCAHGSSCVEHQLWVFDSVNNNAITKLPIKHNGTIPNTANKISTSKDIRQEITEANTRLNFINHVLTWVHFVKSLEGWREFLID